MRCSHYRLYSPVCPLKMSKNYFRSILIDNSCLFSLKLYNARQQLLSHVQKCFPHHMQEMDNSFLWSDDSDVVGTIVPPGIHYRRHHLRHCLIGSIRGHFPKRKSCPKTNTLRQQPLHCNRWTYSVSSNAAVTVQTSHKSVFDHSSKETAAKLMGLPD